MIDSLHTESQQETFDSLQLRYEALSLEHAQLQQAHLNLKSAYQTLLEQHQLLQRRLFVAKAERVDTRQLQLEFDEMTKQLEALEVALESEEEKEERKSSNNPSKPAKKGHGRRNLERTDLPKVVVEVVDPTREALEVIGHKETSKMAYERGGMRHVVIRRAVYKEESFEVSASSDGTQVVENTEVTANERQSRIIVAEMPKELIPNGMLAPSMIAHVLVSKYAMGIPFYRQEKQYRWQGCSLDRSIMCRYAEEIGATLGAIVEAMREEAIQTAFCLATDSTGVNIQPIQTPDGPSRPCKEGHYFVTLADEDHLIVDYQEKANQSVVSSMFKGYKGYIQCDAHSIYNILFRGARSQKQEAEQEQETAKEVGCWSHARRYFWEAAVCKHPEGLEGLKKINEIFACERTIKDSPPSKKQIVRTTFILPKVNEFYEWVEIKRKEKRELGLVSKALGYAYNQQEALRRFLSDGKLKIDNNRSERAIRDIVIGRKNWLFCGNDEYAQAAGNLLSLMGSCRIHSLDPEQYLKEVIQVMPYWPRKYYLRLSPKYWIQTRATLDDKQLKAEYAHLTLPSFDS